MSGMEAGEDCGEHVGADRRLACERDGAARRSRQLLERQPSGIDRGDGALGVGQEAFAGARQDGAQSDRGPATNAHSLAADARSNAMASAVSTLTEASSGTYVSTGPIATT